MHGRYDVTGSDFGWLPPFYSPVVPYLKVPNNVIRNPVDKDASHSVFCLSVFRLAEAAEEQSQTEEALKKQRKSNAELENRLASLNILISCYCHFK